MIVFSLPPLNGSSGKTSNYMTSFGLEARFGILLSSDVICELSIQLSLIQV